MSAPTDNVFDPERPAGGSSRGGQGRIPMWKMALVGISLVLMVAGLGVRGYAQMRRGGSAESKQASASTGAKATQSGRSFLANSAAGFKSDDAPAETKTDSVAAQSVGGLEAWSPTMFRLGFSYFVGFSIAYVLRTFFKMATFSVGVVLILLFGLQYIGMITVHWDVAQRYYESAVNWMGIQTEGLKQFATAQLPSAALAGVGFVVGYKRG